MCRHIKFMIVMFVGLVCLPSTLHASGLKYPGSSSPLTTKGDVYTYSTTNARLPVGGDGEYLKADSGETTGLKWDTVSAGEWTDGGDVLYPAEIGDHVSIGLQDKKAMLTVSAESATTTDLLQVFSADTSEVFTIDRNRLIINSADTFIRKDTPELTIFNTVESDNDGARATSIFFGGKQSGGEEGNLVEIRTTHEDWGDDQYSNMTFWMNDGNDNLAPSRDDFQFWRDASYYGLSFDYRYGGSIDIDTYHYMGTDQHWLYAGGFDMMRIIESSDDYIVFNEGGGNVDFRIEAVDDNEMFYSNGANNRIGISTRDPATTFDISGSFRTTPLSPDDGATITLDASETNFFMVRLEGQPRTLAKPTNCATGQKLILLVSQDATGSRKMGFGSGIHFGSDITTYDASTTAGAKDYIGMICIDNSVDVVAISQGYL